MRLLAFVLLNLFCSFSICMAADVCALNSKIDNILCEKLTSGSDSLYSVNIIFARPVIIMPDSFKGKPDSAFSNFYIDSLAKYLDANKNSFYTIIAENTLYKLNQNTLPENTVLERLTPQNIIIDFSIKAKASKSTILKLASAYDSIVRLEDYQIFGPTISVKSIRAKNYLYNDWFCILNSGKIRVNTSIYDDAYICVYNLQGILLRKYSVKNNIGNELSLNIPSNWYIVSVQNSNKRYSTGVQFIK